MIGKDDEPDSLKVMLRVWKRHIKPVNYPVSLMWYNLSLKDVLEGKVKKLWELGMGKKQNQASCSIADEEEMLWK